MTIAYMLFLLHLGVVMLVITLKSKATGVSGVKEANDWIGFSQKPVNEQYSPVWASFCTRLVQVDKDTRVTKRSIA